MKIFTRISTLPFWVTIWDKRIYIIGGLVVIVIITLSTGVFVMYSRNKQLVIEMQSASSMSENTVQQLLSNLGKLISLPTDEQPTIATVTDPQKLASQSFFALAKTGDKVFVFNKSKRIILYRPVTNKIINAAPLNRDEGQVAGAATTMVKPGSLTPTPSTVSVTIFNGTEIPKLAQKASQRLEGIAGIEVIKQDNAFSQDYSTTTVINLNNVDAGVVEQIAKTFSAKIASLPENETAPEDTDILIIVGNDAVQGQ